MSVVANVSWAVKLVILEIADQVKMRLISLLIKGFSRVFQILLKYLNGTTISTSFALPSAGVFSWYFNLVFKWKTVTKKNSNSTSII